MIARLVAPQLLHYDRVVFRVALRQNYGLRSDHVLLFGEEAGERVKLVHLAFLKFFIDLGFKFLELCFNFGVYITFFSQRSTRQSHFVRSRVRPLNQHPILDLREVGLLRDSFPLFLHAKAGWVECARADVRVLWGDKRAVEFSLVVLALRRVNL